MIILTGGAGMIGSMIAWHLDVNLGRDDILVADRLAHSDQWQNICHRRLVNILDQDELVPQLDGINGVDAVIHMGAISSTTEKSFSRLLDYNIRYSQILWQWCARNDVPFLYASSAATYGGGEMGYDDRTDINLLRPLNAYGFSKQFFDQWVLRQIREGKPAPPRWYGFKYFNVYGPNEYHKGSMASVAYHTFSRLIKNESMSLFRSHDEKWVDGMQMRDFVYVKDAAMATCHFIQNRAASGIYNIGTGKARSFLDLASYVFRSMGREPDIQFVDMPYDLMERYQYFTEANITKLKEAGYTRSFVQLEDGIADYVNNFLSRPDRYC